MLVSDTLSDVREFLNDQNKDRYSDAYLLKLHNEGLLDLSKRLRLFKSEASIPLVQGQAVYSLPLDFIEFEDISINDATPLEFISRTQLSQKVGLNWRQKEVDGPPSHLLYNKQSFYQFRVFPVPTGPSINELYEIDLYGFASDVEDVQSVDTYGIFPSLEDSLNAILFDPTKVNSDLDQISSQVTFLAQQVSQYSSAISANAVAIDQVYGIAASAQATAAAAQLAASGAVTTANSLDIAVDNLTTELGETNSTITILANSLQTVSATATSALNTANAAGSAATAAQSTANSATTIANSAKARLDSVDGAGKTIETLATNVTTVTSTANTALATANAAGTTAGTANNTATSAITVANSTKARIDNIGGGSGPSIETLATNVTALTASIATANGNASSAVTVANTVNARVTNIGGGSGPSIEALATSVTSLSATVGSQSATIAVHTSAIAALESTTASWEVVTNVNSLTNGFGIYNNGSYEEVVFRTAHFKIFPSSGNTGALSFSVEGGQVVIPNAMITNIIQSNNFVSGVQGWQIRRDTASAEFYSVTARGNIQATSLNAATGTFSGTLTAAAINAVDTINVAGQAIVVDTAFFDAASIAVAESSSFTTIGTKSISMTNAVGSSTIGIAAKFFIHIQNLTNTTPIFKTFQFRLLRDGTDIYTSPSFGYSIAGDDSNTYDTSVAIDFLDAPGAGTFNYQMQLRGVDTLVGDSTAFARSLVLSGGKK